MNRKSVKSWEIPGVFFIIFVGSALHFVFAWSGYWRPIAWLAAVNESVWEHTKLAFWPTLVWALLEFVFLRRFARNFGLAKGLALLTMPVVIVAGFYGYTAILGTDYLALDIGLFVLAVVVGQVVSYKLLTAPEQKRWAQGAGVALLLALVAIFSLATYFPPHMALFADPSTGTYGIPRR